METITFFMQIAQEHKGRESERLIGLQDRETYIRALDRLLLTDGMV
jgi:hypothetical protein